MLILHWCDYPQGKTIDNIFNNKIDIKEFYLPLSIYFSIFYHVINIYCFIIACCLWLCTNNRSNPDWLSGDLL